MAIKPQQKFKFELIYNSTEDKNIEEAKIKDKIKTYLPKIVFSLTKYSNGTFLLSLAGSIKELERCKQKIAAFMTKNNISNMRLLDEAEDHVRLKAYPIVGKMEQALRLFIGRAMLEVKGLNWWEDLSFPLIFPRVQEYYKKNKDVDSILHPLECTYIVDLISLIEAEIQPWSDSKIPNIIELLDLLDGCNTLEDFRQKIETNVKKYKPWDEVFSKFFDSEKNEWGRLKEIIYELNDIRNAVMHHRTVSNSKLYILRKLEKEFDNILSSKKVSLTEQEKEEVKEVVVDWQDAVVKIEPSNKVISNSGLAPAMTNWDSIRPTGIADLARGWGSIQPNIGLENAARAWEALQPTRGLADVVKSWEALQPTRAIADTMKAWEALQPSKGLEDFAKSWEAVIQPNRSLTEAYNSLNSVVEGMKLYNTVNQNYQNLQIFDKYFSQQSELAKSNLDSMVRNSGLVSFTDALQRQNENIANSLYDKMVNPLSKPKDLSNRSKPQNTTQSKSSDGETTTTNDQSTNLESGDTPENKDQKNT